jgi:hypothetical protein
VPRFPRLTPRLPSRPPRPGCARLLPSECEDNDDYACALKRAALWSTSYYRFFGARYGREQLPSGLRPMSCGETSRALEALRPHHPETVRRCLSQMLASGYIPDQHNASQFRELVHKVVKQVRPRASAEEACTYLREKGLRDYAEPSAAEAETTIPVNAPRVPIPRPTVITFSGDLFTARKKVLIPHPFRTARKAADPGTWKEMGPFWSGRGNLKVMWDRKKRDSDGNVRNGRVFERFVVNWNALLLQEFNLVLRVTKRKTRDMVRTDYSLIYEEEDQLLVDQGYGEVTRIQGRPGWSLYTGEKTLKFASSLLNHLAPAVLGMFLEGSVESFYKMFDLKRRRSGKRH